MWRNMLMFLLVNTYGRSFGIPVTSQVWNPNLLNDLANRCKNEFVSSQIAMKAKDCNVSTPLMQDVQFRCLIFYDASSLLCDVPHSTLPNLATDFTVKTSDKQNVTSFCGESAHFDIPLTANKNMMSQIFQNGVLCITVCVDENLLSGDTNFVCKYYKWMLDVLQSWHTSIHETGSSLVNSLKASTTETKGSNDGKVNEVLTQQNDTSKEAKELESDVNKVDVQGNTNITSTQHNSNVGPVITGVDHSTERLSGAKNQQINSTKDQNKGEVKVEKTVDIKNHLTPESGADNADPNGESNKDFVIEHPQINGDDDDDNGDPGLDGVGQDNNDDTMDGDGDDSDDHLGDLDTRQQSEKNTGNRVETQMTIGDASQKESANAMTEAFSEDDDHFFPFFLTAVIVVVVLYVMYHNKNKFGKMFFGLIVEGRQPGRRRNSRGHSYRRLDTLEQAMSANTPAPPSKIIY